MKTRKNNTKKIILAIVALLLIGFIVYLAEGLMGNPISKMLVNNAAEKYVDENYNDLDLKLGKAYYEFKHEKYVVAAKPDTSIDTHFEMYFNGRGKLENDYYEDSVLGKFNTWSRINDEYSIIVDTILNENPSYKKESSFGSLIDVYSDFNHLELDKNYNIIEMGKKEGLVDIYLESETVDIETMSKALLEAKQIFDKKGVPFYMINLTLEKPRVDNLPDRENIAVEGFLYKDIYIEGLEKRVEESIEVKGQTSTEKDKEIEEYEKDK